MSYDASQATTENLNTRFSFETLSDWAGKFLYRNEGRENKEINKAAKMNDPRVFSTRWPEFPVWKDLRFPSYPVNEYENYLVCGGPPPDQPAEIENYIESVFFNPYFLNITKLVICGLPEEGERFYDYFSKSGEYGKYKITTRLLKKFSSQTIAPIRLLIENKDTGAKKTIKGRQILKMPDHQIATLTEKDIHLLYKFLRPMRNNDMPDTIFHCAAGLGRSPTMIFAAILARKYNQIFTGSDTEVLQKIESELNAFRKNRPAAVQSAEQLTQAITLAIQYIKIAIKKKILFSRCQQFA